MQLVSRVQLTLTIKREKKYERFHSKKVGFFVTGIVAKEIESS